MKLARRVVATLVMLALAWPLQAGELGEKAPPLKIKEWIKGQPVDVTKVDGKRVYVVEFWATWCAPCTYSIPHLTELQSKFGDKNVTFIGVSVDNDKTVDKVKPFVKDMGDKMDYTVAIDDGGQTAKAYMEAHYVDGIPHAFVIDQRGRLVWHDHPMESLEQVIEQVVDGKFDLADAKKRMAPLHEQRRQAWTLRQHKREYFRLAMSVANEKQATELGKKILEAGREDAMLMNSLAWNILTMEGIARRDFTLALAAAEAANKATHGKNPAILDTYALALFENGRKKEAVSVQEMAVELARKGAMHPEAVAELEERLDRFRKEAE